MQSIFNNNYSFLTWETLSTNHLKNIDVIINLTGENIGEKKWSESQKQRIINSRVKTTKKLAELCAELKNKSPKLFNASAIGIYGLENPSNEYDEDSTLIVPPKDFLNSVGQQWEQALDVAEQNQVTLVKLRFAVVLATQGGALAKLLPSFKLGMGAILGSGQQAFSWICIDDVVHAIEFLLTKQDAQGAYNIVADEIVTQEVFAKTLSRVLHRPCFLFLPNFMVKLIFGQMGEELLLSGQKVRATRLKTAGFNANFQNWTWL